MEAFNFGLVSTVLQLGRQTSIDITTPAGGSSEVSFSPDDGRSTVIAYGINSQDLAVGKAAVSLWSANHFEWAAYLVEDWQQIVCVARGMGQKAVVTVTNQATTALHWTLQLLELNEDEMAQFGRMVGIRE